MHERRKARKDALTVLYQMEIVGCPLDEVINNCRDLEQKELSEFCIKLAKGVIAHKTQIDEMIEIYADNWSLSRMPILDRNIIRICLYEMLFEEDIPYNVSINEAVELAKIFGAAESSKFVNGILGKIASDLKSSKESRA